MKKNIYYAVPVILVVVLASIISGCIRQPEYCPDYQGDAGQGSCQEETLDIDVLDMPGNMTAADDILFPVDELDRDEIDLGRSTLPVVGIHISDYSRQEWNVDGIEYFESYTAMEEILNSHKIPFTEISDRDIEEGHLLIDGKTPRYPIIFSFNNRVVSELEKAQVERYARSGGTVFFTYDSFTKILYSPDLEPQDCFVISDIGLRCLYPYKQNILFADLMEKQENHRIVDHIPDGELAWRMSLYRMTPYHVFLVEKKENGIFSYSGENNTVETVGSSETIPSGMISAGNASRPTGVAAVTQLTRARRQSRSWTFRNLFDNTVSRITARKDESEGINTAFIQYGNGTFIYNSQVNLLWGRYQGEPAIPGAMIALESIRWAFESTGTPLIRVKPWGEYQAAFMMRFDVEPDYDTFVHMVPKLADIMYSEEVIGVFYVLTDQKVKGAFDTDFTFYDLTQPEIIRILEDVKGKGQIIASHSTWHVGPDFDGDEALYNINNSLDMIEEAIGIRPDEWVAPAFGANFDRSLQIIETLGIKTTGDQKIGYLPHFALSPETEGRHYSFLEIPTIDMYHPEIFSGDSLGTILEHHTYQSIIDTVDYYYENNGIINIYSHVKPGNDIRLAHLLNYVKKKDDVWFTTPDRLYDHWIMRESLDYKNIFYENDTLNVEILNSFEGQNRAVLQIAIPKHLKIAQIHIDDSPADLEITGNTMDLAFTLSAKQTGRITIKYKSINRTVAER